MRRRAVRCDRGHFPPADVITTSPVVRAALGARATAPPARPGGACPAGGGWKDFAWRVAKMATSLCASPARPRGAPLQTPVARRVQALSGRVLRGGLGACTTRPRMLRRGRSRARLSPPLGSAAPARSPNKLNARPVARRARRRQWRARRSLGPNFPALAASGALVCARQAWRFDMSIELSRSRAQDATAGAARSCSHVCAAAAASGASVGGVAKRRWPAVSHTRNQQPSHHPLVRFVVSVEVVRGDRAAPLVEPAHLLASTKRFGGYKERHRR